MKTDYNEIIVERKENAVWITINRPEVRNAFREQTLDEMREAVLETRNDTTITCIVFSGAGKEAFSAGGDFYAMKRLNWSNAAHWNDRMLGLAMAIRGVPIPVIAMVNGFCMGGGHELALWCDLVICSDTAVLGQTGARVGACPTVGATQYLPRIVGERIAREMIFLCRTFTGKEAFSAGGDFYAMKRLNWSNAAHWNDRMLGLAMAIRGVPIPVIAMVNGFCMGGGHELALWCDLVICSDTAVLGQTGARVGACPTVGATQYLPRIVGERIAREMIFLCRTFTGKEAVDVGLANKCVSQDKLLDETMNWVKQINTYSGQTIRQTKKSLNSESDELYASWQHGMELLAHVWGSDECMEGMNAFIEKRKPNFFKFREKNAQIVKDYLTGLDNDDNVKPT